MGRRKGDPLEQAAKGFPGRRRGAVEKEIEAVARAASEVAATADDPFPLPEVFTTAPAYYQMAIKIWRHQSDVLLRAGRRRPAYRHALTRYCIWQQFFLAASEQLRKDLPKGGAAIKVVKGDGETVIRTHPNIDFMGKAETALRLLEAEFGFTPVRDQDLLRVESFNSTQGRLPLGGAHPSSPRAAAPEAEKPAGHDPMGLMNDTDSAPPGALN
ncbi:MULTISPECIES: P27 family phage terminase small subunit [Rhizobium/Agrobacterium group]|uniref:Phage terminase small subunit P27 family n=1 Tax=Allorhizobium ampelinum (strain ATCC BAA-846 / DSM 112012 / S4) TaxID=311402 RepID=B9K2R9_ALLAM|nr:MULTISPECIES: P27 family phage terminase small subunit [Rhizobium/Agrobacterium group]ACM39167.1 phage terminase small subunit P27 family [Allorhizobium ampelinum S4]MUO27201.1 terminase [Agrobacterium vitis]